MDAAEVATDIVGENTMENFNIWFPLYRRLDSIFSTKYKIDTILENDLIFNY